ncbi:unnamed protein product [Cladocopium goreaui]|uniref:Calpain-9 (Digestive tract-specific calpain) (Ne w calpain 4) (NCL-4) n=1 Tax=Cladocopium goreaui TaxID=2562237 RepID=A0A9P1FN53_9DINO|nr:unnamed protein product [Cladocopium goreaui]
MLLEKALAKFCGSYGALNSGYPGWAFQVLTGKSDLIFFLNEGKHWRKCAVKKPDSKEDARNPRSMRMVYCGWGSRYNTEDLFKFLKTHIEDKHVLACSIDRKDLGVEARLKNGLVVHHAYALLQVTSEKMDNGQPLRLVQLANPWGSGEWKGDWADYNIFNKGLASGKWAENPELSKRIGVVRRDEGSFWMSYEENATLKERCFQKDWCVKKMLEQMQNVRGEPVIMEAGATARDVPELCSRDQPWEDDVSIVSDLSSWVCVASSQPCFFLADATFKTPSGQALQVQSSWRPMAMAFWRRYVLDHPQEVLVNEVLELWAGDVILRVVPDHCIALGAGAGTKKAKELLPGDLVTVDGHPAALIQVETKSMSCPAPAIKVIMGPDNIPPLMVTRRLSEESPFGSSV